MDYELIKPDEQDAYDPTPFFSYARLRSTDRAERDADVGDVVHFWDTDKCVCQAAIVIASGLDSETLKTFDEYGTDETVTKSRHDEAKNSDQSWHWPCGGH
jgi:hypothetical protein